MSDAISEPTKYATAVARGGRVTQRASLVEQTCRLIEGAESSLTLAELAHRVGMSPHSLHRLFKAETGLTPKAYASAKRAERLRQQLHSPGSRVTHAIYEAGFNSTSRFYEGPEKLLGMQAKQYRAGGKGVVIRFAVGQCSLGAVLVAQSEQGICAILLGDDPEVLAKNFQDRFPRAELVGADPAYEQLVARVVGFVERPTLGLDLPLDVRGTAFQHRVWQALRDIPPGTRLSYTELAERVGVPGAVRAVAGACAANLIAVAIPCHRVVRRDGGSAGYRWGVERKQELLRRESEFALNNSESASNNQAV